MNKSVASPSPTCPDLYNPSEVFAKKEKNLKKLTSAISLLLLCAPVTGLAYFPLPAEIKDICPCRSAL
jgi:hypothetical protein